MARSQSNARQDAQPDSSAKERPAKVIRLRNIRGNIWANKTRDGQNTFYNVTLDRIWKEEDDVNPDGEVRKKGEWHQSPSFGADDLLLVGKVADLCHTWVMHQVQDKNQSF